MRRNRVVVMLTDSELERLERVAARKDQALATAAYELLVRSLKSKARAQKTK